MQSGTFRAEGGGGMNKIFFQMCEFARCGIWCVFSLQKKIFLDFFYREKYLLRTLAMGSVLVLIFTTFHAANSREIIENIIYLMRFGEYFDEI